MKILNSQLLPEVWSPWTSPNSEFPLCRCLPGLHCSQWRFLRIFLLSFLPSVTLKLLRWFKIRWLSRPLKNIPFLCYQKVWSCLCIVFRVTIHLHYETPSSPFCSIGLNVSIGLYTSELIFRLPSSVTSSINSSEPIPLAVIHAHPMTLPPPWHITHDVILWMMSRSLSSPDFFLPTIPSWLHLPKVSDSGTIFWQSLIWPTCSWMLPLVCTLLLSLCIYIDGGISRL